MLCVRLTPVKMATHSHPNDLDVIEIGTVAEGRVLAAGYYARYRICALDRRGRAAHRSRTRATRQPILD